MKKLLAVLAVLCISVAAMGVAEVWVDGSVGYEYEDGKTVSYMYRTIYDNDARDWAQRKNEITFTAPSVNINTNLSLVVIGGSVDHFKGINRVSEFRFGPGGQWEYGGFYQRTTVEAQSS